MPLRGDTGSQEVLEKVARTSVHRTEKTQGLRNQKNRGLGDGEEKVKGYCS